MNEFIDAVLAEAKPEDTRKFLDGLAWIDARSQTDNGAPFAAASAEKQVALLTALSKNSAPAAADQPGVEFFKAIKALTVTGYYTSEVARARSSATRGRCSSPNSRAARIRSISKAKCQVPSAK